MFKVELTQEEITTITESLVVAITCAAGFIEEEPNNPQVEQAKRSVELYKNVCDKLVDVVTKPQEASRLYLPSKDLVTPDTVNEINNSKKLIL